MIGRLDRRGGAIWHCAVAVLMLCGCHVQHAFNAVVLARVMLHVLHASNATLLMVRFSHRATNLLVGISCHVVYAARVIFRLLSAGCRRCAHQKRRRTRAALELARRDSSACIVAAARACRVLRGARCVSTGYCTKAGPHTARPPPCLATSRSLTHLPTPPATRRTECGRWVPGARASKARRRRRVVSSAGQTAPRRCQSPTMPRRAACGQGRLRRLVGLSAIQPKRHVCRPQRHPLALHVACIPRRVAVQACSNDQAQCGDGKYDGDAAATRAKAVPRPLFQ